MLKEAGWDDCCPFWDDDGQGYLVGVELPRRTTKIHLFKLTPDGARLIRESDRIIHQSRGSEANKLYKFNGLYYHFFSEVKPEGRVVMMERAKTSPALEEEHSSSTPEQGREGAEPGRDRADGGRLVFVHPSRQRRLGGPCASCCR